MSQPTNGKRVRELIFPSGEIMLANDKEIKYESEFHGDHAENWFCVYREGKEFQRHNAQYVDTVIWEDE